MPGKSKREPPNKHPHQNRFAGMGGPKEKRHPSHKENDTPPNHAWTKVGCHERAPERMPGDVEVHPKKRKPTIVHMDQSKYHMPKPSEAEPQPAQSKAASKPVVVPGGWMAGDNWDQRDLNRAAGGLEAWKALPEKEQFRIAKKQFVNLVNGRQTHNYWD